VKQSTSVTTTRTQGALAFLLAIAFAACGGGGGGGSTPTSPPVTTPFDFTITVVETKASQASGEAWDCRVSANVRHLFNTGTAGQFATFTEVHIESRYPAGGAPAGSSITWSQGGIDPVEYWGSDRLNINGNLTSSSWGWSSLPQADMRIVMTYKLTLPSGELRSVTKFTQCF